ncbi:MAG: pyridoxal-phosphate dependent enzyme [Candidatus Riflebacteria bacterium]|nr:pyridoxal-phosphate dependent enzyme [Candidatus Riflebacteria bacterium]
MSHSDYALFDRFPDLEQRLPRIDLMAGPSPVHRLERLASGPGLPQIWVKRDDRCAIPYGGNKPRKLELLLAQARALGCRAVLTVGGLGSNHALATCIHGARNGFEVHVLLFPQPVTDHVRMSLRLFSRHATRMSLGSSYEELPRLVDRYLERATASPAPQPSRAGSDMYYIPAGGSTGLGAIGFVNAGLELARQVRAGEMPQPAAIFFPAGTCGTVAGLVVGLKMAGLDARVKAVRVVDPTVANRPTVLALAREAVEILARADRSVPSVTIRDDDFDLLEGYFGAGYGAPTQQGLEAIAA